MNWALSYFQKSREIARLPIHEVIFESLCLSGTETSLTYDRLLFLFLATDQTLSRPDRKKKKKQEKLGEIVRYLRLQSVGNVFEISALFFKSGDSGFQTLGFLLHDKHIKHKLKTIQTRSSMRNSYIQVK